MLKNLKSKNEGFTIIEVLIVLAIAGLILLIVFLAVPALQRNARNTGRKNDVASVLGAMSEYTNNNGGKFPVSCAAGTGTGQCNNATTGFVKNAKVGTMDADKVVFYNDTTTTIAAPATGNLDTIIMFTNAKCQDPKTGTRTGGSSRSMVAMYRVETGGSDDTQCVESGS